MNAPMPLQNQLLATKFFLPIASGTLISRPRLTALLAESLKQPFTLVSAPAGFGKTMLLSAWAQSLPPSNIQVAWVSLDEEDNEPRLFWTYVLSALDQQQPDRFTSLLMQLRSPQSPPYQVRPGGTDQSISGEHRALCADPRRLSPHHRAGGTHDPLVFSRASSSPITYYSGNTC